MVNNHRLTITTGCLNRTDFLRQSLVTWLQAPEPDEIVVVDWNNKIPLEESLSCFKDSRLVFARVVDQPSWKNAKCHNLEIELASGDLLLRLDSDYLLKDNFFAKHPIARGSFYAGNWKPWVGDVERCSLAGALYAYRSDVLAVNGYNERLVYYGCEDDDLFERMATSGLTRTDVDVSTLEHIPHSDKMRYENLEVACKLPQLAPSHELFDESLKKLHLVDKSRLIARQKPWSLLDHRTPWCISLSDEGTTDGRRYSCTEVVKTMTRPSGAADVSFSDQPNYLIPLVRSIAPGKDQAVSDLPSAFDLLFRAARHALD
jgi:hypothetical protein